MANSKKPGPLCQINNLPTIVDDGTLCRCASPLPGTIGESPGMNDHFVWGADGSKSLGEEAWFEQRYPSLMEDARLKMVEVVNSWVLSNWGDTAFKETKQRIAVNARDTSYARTDGSIQNVKKSDNRFERCGDKPQTPHEADKVLGAFSVDIETPVKIDYASKPIGGIKLQGFEWTAVMYVEDVLGLQADNTVVQKLGKWTLKLAPSRRAKRARWKIYGEGLSYVIANGDTLQKIAGALSGDIKNWKIIFEANRSRIPDADRIRPGLRIIIPTTLIKP